MLGETRGGGARLPRRQAETVHAGVDVQSGVEGTPQRTGGRRPFVDFGERAEYGPQARSGKTRAGAGRNAVQHINRGIGRQAARQFAFGEVGDEIGPAAGGGQRARHRRLPQTIGVGLDHGGAFDALVLGHCRQLAPVGNKRGEIDGQQTGLMRFEGVVGQRHAETIGRKDGAFASMTREDDAVIAWRPD